MHQAVPQQQVVDIEEIVSDRGRTVRSLHEEGHCSSPGVICPARFGCPSARQDQCRNVVKHYHTQEAIEEEQDSDEDRQTLRHIVLLILLACSMFVVSQQKELEYIYLTLCLERHISEGINTAGPITFYFETLWIEVVSAS
jgi:hypothetical protein